MNKQKIRQISLATESPAQSPREKKMFHHVLNSNSDVAKETTLKKRKSESVDKKEVESPAKKAKNGEKMLHLNGSPFLLNEKPNFQEEKENYEPVVKTDYLNAGSIENNYEEIKLESDITRLSATHKVKKSKFINNEELQAQKDKHIQYLNKFVDISLKYSQFLNGKISSSNESSKLSSKSSKSNTNHLDITKQLKYFRGELRPYQVEGVTWLTLLFENSVNGILADEMGLGKTIQIIALFCHLYERKVPGPFLIVAPLSTLGNWESEFERFAPKLPVIRLQGNADERVDQKRKIRENFKLDGHTVKPIVVCSYQVPLSEAHFLQSFTWQYIIVDEGHRIKNPESKLSIELRNLKSINRTLLTGTPLQNDIKELWALFNFVMPELFKDNDGFSTLLELDEFSNRDQLLENEAKTNVISNIHKILAPFMLRREKKLVLTDTVPKKEVIIYCSLTKAQTFLYRATLKNDMHTLSMGRYKNEDQNLVVEGKRSCRQRRVDYSIKKFDFEEDNQLESSGVEKLTSFHSTAYQENMSTSSDVKYAFNLTMQNPAVMLKKIVNHPYLVWCPLQPAVKTRQILIDENVITQSGKFLVLDALLPKLKAGGHKVLIFSTLVMLMDIVEEMLMMRNFTYRRLDGQRNLDNRKDAISDFTNDPDVFIFLISTRAGGLGLNLTAADTVIFMDRDWNPMADLQAQDRCHRIGQNKPVMVYSLITKGTIDEIILSRGDMKRRLEKVVLQEGKFKTMTKSFTDDEIKELEELLNKEEELKKVHANGLMYTETELDAILDRKDLEKEMSCR